MVQPKEKKPEADSKDRKLGQHTEELKKKSEVKLKDKERGAALSVTSNNSREEVENEPKGKSSDLSLKPPREEVRHRSKARTEETTDRKGREKSKDEKKVAEVAEIKSKAKEASVRILSVSKGKEEEQTKSGKKPAEVITLQSKHVPEKITPASPDSVFDFKDEVEVVETRENTVFEKLKPVLDAKSKIPKVPEKPLEAGGSQTGQPAKPVGTDYASFAAQTKMEATSSSSPASEDDDTPLIIAVENEVTEVTEIDPDEPVIEEGGNGAQGKSGPASNAKLLKSSEPTEQEQLEKSIASITGDARSDNTSDPSETDNGAFVPAPVEQKRTVISQEETENAINALLGESFESFEEPVEPSTVTRPVDSMEVGGDDEAASAVAGLAEDEAASAVLGLEMSPVDPWGNTNAVKQQEDESIENIAAEIRR